MSQHTEETDQQEETSQQGNGQQHSGSGRAAAEWIVFAVAALILAAVVAVITSDAVGTRGPPTFTTTVTSAAERNGAHYLTVAVENTGDITASDVKVCARLRQDGRIVEQATQAISFLAGQETRQVTFVFERDPRTLDLRTRVSSFQTT